MLQSNFNHPHRRKNILNGDWVLVSPQRTNRPWQGEIAEAARQIRALNMIRIVICVLEINEPMENLIRNIKIPLSLQMISQLLLESNERFQFK